MSDLNLKGQVKFIFGCPPEGSVDIDSTLSLAVHDAVEYHLNETGGIFETLDELLIRQKVSVSESRVCADCKLEWKFDLYKVNGIRLS